MVLCAFAVRWSFRRIEHIAPTDRRSYLVAGIGFVILLLASSSLEALRLHTLKAVLPQAPGGIIGVVLSRLMSKAIGFTGATLVLLALIAIGWSLFTGISWIAVLERFGGWLDAAYVFCKQRWAGWQDRRAGAAAVIEREEVVEESKKKFEIHEPIHIEPPKVEIPKSPRVEREKQVPLFENLPDSPLPPLKLLDDAEKAVAAISTETLEFTSDRKSVV